MTIRAKYPGRCSQCGGRIVVGSEIEWSKGSPARHSCCGAPSIAHARTRRTTSAPRRSSFPATAPEPGAHRVSGRSRGRDDRYTVGQVLHAPKISVAGGGPDGHWYTVLAETWYFEPTRAAWVRAATDAEAAPGAARLAAKEQSASLRAELVALAQAGTRVDEAEAGSPPAGREVIIQGSGREVCRLTEDGSVALWWDGHYDDYRRSLWITRDPRAVEIMTVLLGGAQ
jgi:hypothetical protein